MKPEALTCYQKSKVKKQHRKFLERGTDNLLQATKRGNH